MNCNTGFFSNEVDHAYAAERFGQVGWCAIDVDNGGANGIASSGNEKFFGNCHHIAVVAKCLVELHHGELGVVASRDAFVAKHAANFIHALHAANNEALQVQFKCNAQKERHVERVVMRVERASVRSACFSVQNWCFYFNETFCRQCFAERRNNGVANGKGTACFIVRNEVGIALAVASVGVGEAVPFVGKRAYCFSEQNKFVDLD